MVWEDALATLRTRCRLLGTSSAPSSINGALYGSRVASVCSYVAQFDLCLSVGHLWSWAFCL
eukprot:3443511-Pyramimonas_sp.AAC.1